MLEKEIEISNFIIEFLEEKYNYLSFKKISDEPFVVSVNEEIVVNLLIEHGDQEDTATNYQLLENIVIDIIDSIRTCFDKDCDYSIGGERPVEIYIF